LAGGLKHEESNFRVTAAQTAASLMTLACISESLFWFPTFSRSLPSTKALVIPAAYFWSQTGGNGGLDLILRLGPSGAKEENIQSGLLIISRGTAIMLLFVYAAYLYFQLKTHAYLFKPKPRIQNEDADPDQVQAQTEEEEELEMAPVAAGVALLLVTVITSFAADYRKWTWFLSP
jgi:Ca2+:H+ antiporter